MQPSNIIPFPVSHPAAAPATFDCAAHQQRVQSRFRRACICGWITTAVEAVVTVAIGACITVSTLVFLTLL